MFTVLSYTVYPFALMQFHNAPINDNVILTIFTLGIPSISYWFAIIQLVCNPLRSSLVKTRSYWLRQRQRKLNNKNGLRDPMEVFTWRFATMAMATGRHQLGSMSNCDGNGHDKSFLCLFHSQYERALARQSRHYVQTTWRRDRLSTLWYSDRHATFPLQIFVADTQALCRSEIKMLRWIYVKLKLKPFNFKG